MPILAARLSQSKDEQIGSFFEVTVQPAILIERDEGVVVRVCGTGEGLEITSASVIDAWGGYKDSVGRESIKIRDVDGRSVSKINK